MGVRRQGDLGEVRQMQPRPVKLEFFSSGKHVYVDREERQVMPDPAIAAAALQRGEVDCVEWPLIDLIPMLKNPPA